MKTPALVSWFILILLVCFPLEAEDFLTSWGDPTTDSWKGTQPYSKGFCISLILFVTCGVANLLCRVL